MKQKTDNQGPKRQIKKQINMRRVFPRFQLMDRESLSLVIPLMSLDIDVVKIPGFF
jgi:hypothetical protein